MISDCKYVDGLVKTEQTAVRGGEECKKQQEEGRNVSNNDRQN